MQCAVRRWGPGTTCERPANTVASKELQQRLTALNAERSKQDKMWEEELVIKTVETVKPIQTIENKNKTLK